MIFKSGRWLLLGILLGGLCYWTISQRLTHTQVSAVNSAPMGAVSVSAPTSFANENTQPNEEPPKATRDVSQAKVASEAEWRQFLNTLETADWKVRRNDRGRVTIVTGGMFRLPYAGIKDAISWARKLAELSGVPATQIVDNGEMLPQTDLGKTYHYPQGYDGYEVADSFINVFERGSDGAIYYTAMELSDIGTPDLSLNKTLAVAEGLGKQSLLENPKVKEVEVIARPNAPVIYSRVAGQSELAWRIVYQLSPNHDERELMISAVTGKTLRDIRVLSH